MRSKNAQMVAQFRHHFGLTVRSFPDVFAADLDLHGKLLAEEVSEYLIAVKDRDPVEILDTINASSLIRPPSVMPSPNARNNLSRSGFTDGNNLCTVLGRGK